MINSFHKWHFAEKLKSLLLLAAAIPVLHGQEVKVAPTLAEEAVTVAEAALTTAQAAETTAGSAYAAADAEHDAAAQQIIDFAETLKAA